MPVPDEVDSGLVYQRATTAQIIRHFENNSQMWAAPLSKAEYVDLQKQLSKTRASCGNTAYWVLLHRDDPETIISSCTTYMRDAIVNAGQGMKPVNAVVVTDIFTLPEYRRKGMATMLLTRLQETLDKVADRVEFSVVYSDVRSEFYERLGWKPQPATHLRIVLGKGAVELPPESDLLVHAQLSQLAELDNNDVNVAKLRLSALRDKKTYAQLLPTRHLMQWHMVRCCILRSRLAAGKGKAPGALYGASATNGEADVGVWAWWAPDFRSRRIYVGRLAATRLRDMEAEVKAVLAVAAAEAWARGLRELVLWEPTEQVVKGASLLVEELGQGARIVVEERTDMVPCVRWHGGEDKEGGLVDAQFYGWS